MYREVVRVETVVARPTKFVDACEGIVHQSLEKVG